MLAKREYSHGKGQIYSWANAHWKPYSGSYWFAPKRLVWIIFLKWKDSLVTAKHLHSCVTTPGPSFPISVTSLIYLLKKHTVFHRLLCQLTGSISPFLSHIVLGAVVTLNLHIVRSFMRSLQGRSSRNGSQFAASEYIWGLSLWPDSAKSNAWKYQWNWLSNESRGIHDKNTVNVIVITPEENWERYGGTSLM